MWNFQGAFIGLTRPTRKELDLNEHWVNILTARNSDRALAAFSALSRAMSRFAMRRDCSSSHFLRSVMSVMEPAILVGMPSLFQRAWPRTRNQRYSPSPAWSSVSTSKGGEQGSALGADKYSFNFSSTPSARPNTHADWVFQIWGNLICLSLDKEHWPDGMQNGELQKTYELTRALKLTAYAPLSWIRVHADFFKIWGIRVYVPAKSSLSWQKTVTRCKKKWWIAKDGWVHRGAKAHCLCPNT